MFTKQEQEIIKKYIKSMYQMKSLLDLNRNGFRMSEYETSIDQSHTEKSQLTTSKVFEAEKSLIDNTGKIYFLKAWNKLNIKKKSELFKESVEKEIKNEYQYYNGETNDENTEAAKKKKKEQLDFMYRIGQKPKDEENKRKDLIDLLVKSNNSSRESSANPEIAI